jgi:hypothetical protein
VLDSVDSPDGDEQTIRRQLKRGGPVTWAGFLKHSFQGGNARLGDPDRKSTSPVDPAVAGLASRHLVPIILYAIGLAYVGLAFFPTESNGSLANFQHWGAAWTAALSMFILFGLCRSFHEMMHMGLHGFLLLIMTQAMGLELLWLGSRASPVASFSELDSYYYFFPQLVGPFTPGPYLVMSFLVAACLVVSQRGLSLWRQSRGWLRVLSMNRRAILTALFMPYATRVDEQYINWLDLFSAVGRMALRAARAVMQPLKVHQFPPQPILIQWALLWFTFFFAAFDLDYHDSEQLVLGNMHSYEIGLLLALMPCLLFVVSILNRDTIVLLNIVSPIWAVLIGQVISRFIAAIPFLTESRILPVLSAVVLLGMLILFYWLTDLAVNRQNYKYHYVLTEADFGVWDSMSVLDTLNIRRPITVWRFLRMREEPK